MTFLPPSPLPASRFITPVEGIGVILWWIIEEIVENSNSWFYITSTSLATTLAEVCLTDKHPLQSYYTSSPHMTPWGDRLQ